MTTQKRLNPFKTLSELPHVLEIRDVAIACQSDRKATREILFRWNKAGYISQFSYGVYFNLVANPRAPHTHIVEAANRAVRQPKVLLGVSALHEGGWTTQMPSRYEMAVATDENVRSWKKMDGIDVVSRPAGWFARVMRHTITASSGFQSLTPAFALVDSIMTSHNDTVIWHPDADDICLPIDKNPLEALEEIGAAVQVLHADKDGVMEYVAQIPDLSDAFNTSNAGQQINRF